MPKRCFSYYIAIILLITFLLAGSTHLLMAQAPAVKRVFYGQASFYANKFHGRKTASGEIFNQQKFTCACNVLPIGTWIKVTNVKNGRTISVKVNDRLHPKMKRLVDLTRAAAAQLNMIVNGTARVKVEVLGKNASR